MSEGEHNTCFVPEEGAAEESEAQVGGADSSAEEPRAEVSEAPGRVRACKRIGECLVVLVVLVAVVGVIYYWPEVGAFFRLKAWSQRGPREAFKAYERALRSNDVKTLERLLPEQYFGLTIKDGKVTHITPKSVAQSPPIAIKHFLPAAGSQLVVRYDLRPIKWGAQMTARCENGLYCRYTLRRAGSQWYFVSMSPHRPGIDTP